MTIFKQWMQVHTGDKTQTRRVVQDGDAPVYDWFQGSDDPPIKAVFSSKGRKKWEVGKDYAVVPKRGQPGLWVDKDFHGGVVFSNENSPSGTPIYTEYRTGYGKGWKQAMRTDGWQELRYRILDIRREPLQDISAEDALAEGVNSQQAYVNLWEDINGASSWWDNPDVWVIEFERFLK